MSEVILLTGATGFVGMELLARLVEEGEDEVVCLVRAGTQEEADARLAGVFARIFDEPPAAAAAVTAMPCDVGAEDLGLAPEHRGALVERVTSVIHCAASIAFDRTLEEARQVNTGGALRMLELSRQIAERGHLRRHLHVSTAYVAGRFGGRFLETDLDVGQRFRNTYEESKFEGERTLGEHAGELPLLIVRPSIIVGDSRTGWTSAFNVIYWPVRAFSRGLMDEIAIDPDGVVDIVPIDYVGAGVLALLRDPHASGTVALVAGESAPSNAELIELASRQFGREPPRIVATPASRLADADLYVPYFGIEASLDDTRARELLVPHGLVVPPLRDYFGTLIDFAERARWGKVTITRQAAAAAVA